jgi:glycosyltransferase involved in cell wall biosynthesis
MKVLIIIDSLAKGGKERRMLELIKELKADSRLFEILLVSLTDVVEYDYVYNLPVHLTIIKRKFKKDPSVIFRLRKIIRDFNPAVIHSWGTMSSVYIMMVNMRRRIPFINGVIADAHPHLNITDKHYFRVKLTTPFSDVFVSNSLAGIKAYGTPRAKSVCIYNGIDFGRFSNLTPAGILARELWPEGKAGRFVITMVAAFEKRKDYATLIRAATTVCATDRKIVFLLIGDGSELDRIKEMTPSSLLGSNIIFLGKRKDVEALLQLTDLGVLITNSDVHGEGISNAIIEYMASGKPVIATRGGGTNEIVENGTNGYLIEPKNPTLLAQKIRELVNNTELCAKMGEAGYRLVHDRFDIKKNKEQYISLYRRLARS